MVLGNLPMISVAATEKQSNAGGMAIPLFGKAAIALITLGVIAGLTTVIVLLVNSDDDSTHDYTTTTMAPPTSDNLELPYQVGVGIADMTGPCVEVTFMGYAEVGQTGEGIHTRQFSRAFIFAKGDKRVVLVTAEVQAVGIAVRRECTCQ
ncbi:unnamed protein product [Leptidea sinapis]|uniref:Neutral ceramidase n=1 Tax=Leptidea sinapis TaxID=189913 RepID=A0A5E4R2Z5_9NEOP|nr:unnamed protein product [Leptidea sinapis]